MILPPPLSTAAVVVVVAAQFHLNTHTKAREKVGQAEKEKTSAILWSRVFFLGETLR